MIGYAAGTTGHRARAALKAAGWRALLTPDGVLRHRHTPLSTGWALDNGAWYCHARGLEWSADDFRRLLDLYADGADWIALPDIVGGGLRSLERSLEWRDEVAAYGRLLLLPVQDGMVESDVAWALSDRVGIFVGGTTKWKISTLSRWGDLARRVRCYCHVGRVNTVRRIRLCAAAGAHSWDGSSVARWPKNLQKLDAARRFFAAQLELPTPPGQRGDR